MYRSRTPHLHRSESTPSNRCTKVLLQNLAVVHPVASVPELVLRSMRTSQTAVSHPKAGTQGTIAVEDQAGTVVFEPGGTIAVTDKLELEAEPEAGTIAVSNQRVR